MSDSSSAPKRSALKIILFVLLLFAPIIVLMVIFTPFAEEKITERIVNDYRLPSNYTQEDIVNTVKKMRRDPEFQFYFFAIPLDRVAEATYEVFETMDRSRGQEALKTEMNQLQEKIKAMAVVFYHMDYGDSFIEDPSAFPDLKKILDDLVYEEFKLAVMGVCYKSTYDDTFRFEWTQTERLAAQKLHKVLKQISQ